jgi:hypothetical protein
MKTISRKAPIMGNRGNYLKGQKGISPLIKELGLVVKRFFG